LEPKEFKSIPISDQFFKVVLDISRTFLETNIKTGMFWWLFDWCESKAMMDHDVETIAKVLESEVMEVWGAKVYSNRQWH
jgi:hypothetical protein